jgi:hypothetical protein
MLDVRTISGYGPFSPGLSDPAEIKAQLRSMATNAYMLVGPDNTLWRMLRAAETDAVAFGAAQDMVEALPALTLRRLLSTHQAVTWPRPPRRTAR